MGLWTGILGDPGAGKTNLLAATGFQELRFGIREKVIANFHLNYPPEIDMGRTSFMPFTEIIDGIVTAKEAKDSPFYRVLLLIDELSEEVDAYRFLTKTAVDEAKMVSQFRKFEAYGYYSDQRYNKIPKRVRDQTSGFILMEDIDSWNYKKHPPYARECAGDFGCDFYNADKVFIKRQLFDGKPTRNFYNTGEIVLGRDRLQAIRNKANLLTNGKRKSKIDSTRGNQTPDEIFTEG